MFKQKILSNGHAKNRLGQKFQIGQEYFFKMVLLFCTTVCSIVYGAQHLYIVDGTDGQVRVIDTDSNSVVRIFNVGLGEFNGGLPSIAFTPDGAKALINNPSNNSISVIDRQQGTITHISEGIGALPSNIAMTPNGKKAYVTNYEDNSVSWIDTETYQAGQITGNIGTNPFSIVITPDGSKAYLTNKSSMSWIDLASNQANTININYNEIDDLPFFNPLAITPDSAYVYVADIVNSDQVIISIIDTKTNTVTATIDGVLPSTVALTPDGKKVIAGAVTPGDNNTILPAVGVVNTATNELLEVVSGTVGGVRLPFCTAITPNGKKAYITYPVGNRVMAFDIATNTFTNIDRPNQDTPMYIAITPDSKKVYINNSASKDILVIDTATDQAGMISSDIGPSPIGVFMAPSPLPPASVVGYQKEDQFLTQTDLINIIQWNPPPKQGPLPVRYAIYRDANLTQLIKTVTATAEGDVVEFKEHNCKPHTTYTYYVVSIDANGCTSPAVEATILPVGRK